MMDSLQTVSVKDPGITAAQRAIQLDREYRSAKVRVEELKTERNLAIEEAYLNGIRDLDGFKFIKAKPSKTVTVESITDYDLEHGTHLGDDYIAWWRANCEIKVTATSFQKFLDHLLDSMGYDENAKKTLLDGVLVDSEQDRCEYQMKAPKGASE